jgi:hypothetical protein
MIAPTPTLHDRREAVVREVFDGDDAVRGSYAASRAAFPDQRNTIHALHHTDDGVFVEFDLPVALAGPTKGAPMPLTPADVRNPGSHLVCYAAVLAKKLIAQPGCGPTNPKDKGTKITPPQSARFAQLGVHVANQFGTGQRDSKKATLLCIPSAIVGPGAVEEHSQAYVGRGRRSGRCRVTTTARTSRRSS